MADFYGTAAGYKEYWAARGNDQSAVLNADVDVALLIASEFLDGAFAGYWPGLKVGGREQVRDWPRSSVQDRNGNAVPSDSVPREVENAAYEAALRQLTTPGIFFKDYTPGKYTRVSISGALAVDYAVGDAWSFQTQLPVLAAVLGPLIAARGAVSGLSGAIGR